MEDFQMAELKWIRIVTDIFENPKIILLDSEKKRDEILTIWFKLLCLAGKCNNDGLLTIADKPYTVKMFAAAFNRKPEAIQNALLIFKEYNMIQEINGIISILNWSKHQSTDRIDKLNDRQREYMRSYRIKQKALCNDNGKANGNNNRNAYVSALEDRGKKKDIEVRTKEGGDKEPPTPTNRLYNEIMDAWNDIIEIPTLEEITEERRVMIEALLAKYGVEKIIDAIDNVKHSNFLRGLKSGTDGRDPFLISFEWFLDPKNFLKVLEGKYADGTGKTPMLDDDWADEIVKNAAKARGAEKL